MNSIRQFNIILKKLKKSLIKYCVGLINKIKKKKKKQKKAFMKKRNINKTEKNVHK